jgi:hypothetical protein
MRDSFFFSSVLRSSDYGSSEGYSQIPCFFFSLRVRVSNAPRNSYPFPLPEIPSRRQNILSGPAVMQSNAGGHREDTWQPS